MIVVERMKIILHIEILSDFSINGMQQNLLVQVYEHDGLYLHFQNGQIWKKHLPLLEHVKQLEFDGDVMEHDGYDIDYDLFYLFYDDIKIHYEIVLVVELVDIGG
jgi:hypothetical protein